MPDRSVIEWDCPISSLPAHQLMTFHRVNRLLAVGMVLAFLSAGRWAQGEEEAPRRITNSLGMQLVLIAAGSFQMGSPESEPGRREEEHRHEVRITRPFYIAAHEVTQRQYARVMGENPSSFSRQGAFRERVAGLDTGKLPADSVSWAEACGFCRRLSQLPAEKKAGRVYRLPTEAQWEYACRAGRDSIWCFGDDLKKLSDFAHYRRGREAGRPLSVGSKKPNRWGIHDMHGNLWEWCADGHTVDYYRRSPRDDPPGPDENRSRVIRGGSWYSRAASTRSAARRGDPPAVREPDTGFRVVLTLP